MRGAGIQILESLWQELCIGWERKSLKRSMIWEGERGERERGREGEREGERERERLNNGVEKRH